MTCSAWNLVRFLRKLADQGQAILCTIHQPSSLLFESFDRLLLLERGGETVYFGEIGEDSSVILEYFSRHGATCPANTNPAEFMLEAIGAGVTPRIGSRDWKDIWLESPEHEQVKAEIATIKRDASLVTNEDQKEFNTCECPLLDTTQAFHNRLKMPLHSCINFKLLCGETIWHCGDHLITSSAGSSCQVSYPSSYLYPSCN